MNKLFSLTLLVVLFAFGFIGCTGERALCPNTTNPADVPLSCPSGTRQDYDKPAEKWYCCDIDPDDGISDYCPDCP
jgi:hypothetical protein